MQRITYTLAEFVGEGHGLTQERTSLCVYGTGHKGTGQPGRWDNHSAVCMQARVGPADSDNHAARCIAVRSTFKRPARERSQISTATVLIEKPLQNAIPKNWLGVRCVSGLVAKKMPIIGRVVAIPRRMPIARVIHSSFRFCSPRNCHARNSENIKRVLKKRTANRSSHPPIESVLIA